MTITERVGIIAGINLSFAGIQTLISKAMPFLGALSVLIQIGVGGYSLYHIFASQKKKKKKKKQ